MLKIFKFLLIAVFSFAVLIILVFIVERNKRVTLPPPTGKYGVGRITYEWTDTSRIDSLALKPGVKRQLFIWVWYPAATSKSDTTSEYLPEDWRNAIAERQGRFARFFSKKLSKIQVHSLDGVKLPSSKDKYPVVLIKSGIGTLTTDYTTIAENLASHGYVVVGSDSPYSSNVVVFSGNKIVTDNTKGNPSGVMQPVDRNRRLDRLVTIWSDDNGFILDKLEELNDNDSKSSFYHRLDLKKVGILGHAMGGAAAYRFCFKDDRCKAGICINGTPFGDVTEDGLSKPFMFLMADNSGDSTSHKVNNLISAIYKQMPESSVWINLKGAKHFNFSDQALIKEQFIAKRSSDIGSINKRRGLEITASCVQTFFDANLKGIKNIPIKDLHVKYPEVVLHE